MTELIIQEWLTEWSGIETNEIRSNATVLGNNEEVIGAIHHVLEEQGRFGVLHRPVCNQLFSYYRSKEPGLQKFTLQFIPTLLYSYLSSVAAGNKKDCRSVETLLLGIYNLDAVSETGVPVVFSFRLPSLAQSSIYHEPTREAITDASLRRFEEVNTKPVTWGPLPQTEVINAQNRLQIVTALLFIYNQNIGELHKSSLKNLCRTASKIVTQGFPQRNQFPSSPIQRVPPRIRVSSQFLLELASGLYYAMYNNCGYYAMEAIEDMYQRGCFECYSDVVLVINAIKNSSHVSPTGQPADGPMGISVAISPATTTVTTVNKSMITNASFRTKKLPDDIPIIPGEGSAPTTQVSSTDGKQLSSISEDKEDESNFTPRGSSLRGKDAVTKNLQKLGIGKKPKTKSTSGSSGDKKSKKSPLVHNGDVADGGESPLASSKRKSGVENGDAINGGDRNNLDSSGPESLEIGHLDDEIRRLDSSPTGHRKLVDHEDKSIMQVSSV